MVNTLTTLRTEVKDALTQAGISAVEYVKENIVPPVVVVIPADPYVTKPANSRFGSPYTVGINLLIIAGAGSNETASAKTDALIVNVIEALEDEFDITEVSSVQEMALSGIPYLGAVVTLEVQTNITKEVM